MGLAGMMERTERGNRQGQELLWEETRVKQVFRAELARESGSWPLQGAKPSVRRQMRPGMGLH